jgi:hypothetical protein
MPRTELSHGIVQDQPERTAHLVAGLARRAVTRPAA